MLAAYSLQLLRQTSVRCSVRHYTQYLKQHAYVGGAWMKANDGKTFAVTNPATGEELGQVADLGPAEMEVAIKKAYDAFNMWRDTSAKKRCETLKKMFELMMKNQEDLGKLMTVEQVGIIRTVA